MTLVPALTDLDMYETPMGEIAFNAPTPVSRERICETIYVPMCDTKNSTLHIPVPDLKNMTYATI